MIRRECPACRRASKSHEQNRLIESHSEGLRIMVENNAKMESTLREFAADNATLEADRNLYLLALVVLVEDAGGKLTISGRRIRESAANEKRVPQLGSKAVDPLVVSTDRNLQDLELTVFYADMTKEKDEKDITPDLSLVQPDPHAARND